MFHEQLLVGTGKDSAATKIDNLISLLEIEMSGDEERLVKTMRAIRNALLAVYRDVEHREMACMMHCSCMDSEKHSPWPSAAAGCRVAENNLAGRLWDVAEFLRQHSGYEQPKLVAFTTVEALKELRDEFRFKEEQRERFERKGREVKHGNITIR
jgi:hypothetical protein